MGQADLAGVTFALGLNKRRRCTIGFIEVSKFLGGVILLWVEDCLGEKELLL
jgi:hypothetical protein